MPKIANIPVSIFVILLASFISWSLGDGWLLSSMGLSRQSDQLELQSTGVEIDRVVAISELRQKKLEIYASLIQLGNEYDDLEKRGVLTSQELYRLRQKLEIAKENYVSVERDLAKLESREPKPLRYELPRPMAPSGLSAE